MSIHDFLDLLFTASISFLMFSVSLAGFGVSATFLYFIFSGGLKRELLGKSDEQ